MVLNLSRSAAAVIASSRNLRGQLESLAAVLSELPGIGGAIAVALDEEGNPLTAGTSRVNFSDDRSQLDILFDLHQQLAPQLHEDVWIKLATDYLMEEDGRPHSGSPLARPVCSASRVLGLVLVTISSPIDSERSLEAIARGAEILGAAIHSALRAEAWSRIETLQQLAWKTFDRPDWDLSDLVHQLAALFDAAAVTMLLRDQEELRLAVSTDSELGRDKPVLYQRDEGLTGYVFATGKPLRLSDTGDREEIRRVIGRDRERALHPERDLTGIFTGQFLGVAMRFGGKVVGVLRISRRQGIARFTREDEKALQFFADLLGAALAPAWDLLLEKSVLESVTELIAVSRREERDNGSAVSRIVMANMGAEILLGRSRKEIEGREAREIYDPEVYEKLQQVLRESR